ncbi:aminopeptidase N-like [Planococcus citri]|uniref:aminopeptidase N-like n=1 Tax=Planococcus citri TaxID=170843 RepID=UPI0031F8FFB7
MSNHGLVFFVFLSISSLSRGFVSIPPLNNTQTGVSPNNSNVTTEKNHTALEKIYREIYRLTDEVSPISYELRFVPDFKNWTFFGKVDISIRVKFTTNKIILNSRNLTLQSVKVFKIDTSKILVNTSHKLDEFNDLLIIETWQSLPFGTDYIVVIEFQGVIGDNLQGFYRSSYSIGSEERWIVVTHFEPNYARQAFPCFDEPRFRTPFTIYLARFPEQFAVSNMPWENRLPSDSMSGGDRLWEKFQKSPAMPTYLVSFMVSDFSYITETEGRIRIIARKNILKKGAYALKQSTKALKTLEDYIGISYKLPKLDLVAVPDFSSGGMENWGMVTFREQTLLTDESTSSAQHRQDITQTITHELAHLWFGDLVTPVWYSYLWLKEGFATYFGAFATATFEPTWNLDHLFVIEKVQVSLLHETFAVRSMTSMIKKAYQIEGVYDIISYNKAASVIRMFEHMVSPNTFRNVLHNFISDGEKVHEGVVIEKNLLDAFDIESQRYTSNILPRLSVVQIIKSWTENIGYPLIYVNRSYDDGKMKITQSPYKPINISSPIKFQNWIVPLTFTTKSKLQFYDTRPAYWSLVEGPVRIEENTSSTDWVLFNLQHVGYYRVNYDMKNWDLLIEQLKQDHQKIHVLNRAQLISDAYALAYDKYLSYRVPIKLTEYLVNETDMIPWYAVIQQLNFLPLRSRLDPGDSSDRFFTNYLRDLFKKSYQTIGFEIQSNDSHVTKIVKPQFLTWACSLNIEDCVQKSLDHYERHKANLTKIQPDLKPVVYCFALRNSTDQEMVFHNLWATFLKYDDSFEKHHILAAFACATDTAVIKKILSKMMDPKNKEIRKQDWYAFYSSAAIHLSSGTAILEFVDEKIDKIPYLNQEGVTFLENLLRRVVYTDDRLQQLKQLEIKFGSLDQNKYGNITEIMKKIQTNMPNIIERNLKKLERIHTEVFQLNESSSTTTTSETKQSPSSGATISISIFVSLLCSVLSVLRYSLLFLDL